MVKDLMIIPVDVNGSKLNFLLDTGVSRTIMFNLSVTDSSKLKNITKLNIRGLGESNFIEAIQSTGNHFKIGQIFNNNHLIYLITGNQFDLSKRLGVDINGIIGSDLFKNLILDINYSSKKIKLYNKDNYKFKKCKKCEIFNLTFHNKKPYIDVKIASNNKIIDAHLLIDTGGGKSLWLFDKSDKNIKLPDHYFTDFLGRGLSGDIYGRSAKIEKIFLGKYELSNANVSYPDSSSIPTAYSYKKRNGSIGAGILKRFKLIFDYQGKQMIIKKKSSHFKDPFTYNMSGIDLVYGGKVQVGNLANNNLENLSNDKPIIQVLYEYVYGFKDAYEINYIRENSPAYRAGLKEGDRLLKINNKSAYNYELEEIIHLFSTKENKKIELLIERNGIEMLYDFVLEKIF